LLTGAALSGAQAHETWLLPRDFTPAVGEATSLVMTSGMAFPELNAGIDPRRISEAVLVQDGERYSLVPAGMTEAALELTTSLREGDACAWVGLRPRILEIEADGVAHYLEEIGASDANLSAWAEQPEPRTWRESYAKVARTYLRSEPATSLGRPCWTAQSDARFDILPTSNPSVLRAGDAIEVQVLFDGQPLAGQAVGLMHEGEKEPLQRSNAEGVVRFTFGAAGSYMIFATHLRPQQGDDFNWESDFVTLTLDVKD
jgi:hypothetical protein